MNESNIIKLDGYRHRKKRRDKMIQATELLNKCDNHDICRIFDSGIFDAICENYVAMACYELGLNWKEVIDEMENLLCHVTAEEMEKYLNG